MKLAIMGFGTIGSGVAAIVEQNAALIERRIGAPLEIKYVLALREFPGTSVEHKVVHDIDIIVNDPEIDVVVETIGGVEPACTFVKKALNAGKSVTTSNKVLVEKKGAELLALAGDEAFVIGGQEVYAQLLPYCTRVYVTKVFADAPADAFFPNLDQDPHWKPVSVSEVLEENGLKFQYVEYEKTEP